MLFWKSWGGGGGDGPPCPPNWRHWYKLYIFLVNLRSGQALTLEKILPGSSIVYVLPCLFQPWFLLLIYKQCVKLPMAKALHPVDCELVDSAAPGGLTTTGMLPFVEFELSTGLWVLQLLPPVDPVLPVPPPEPVPPVDPVLPVLPVPPPEPVLPVDPVPPVLPVPPPEPVLPVDPVLPVLPVPPPVPVPPVDPVPPVFPFVPFVV